MIKNKNDLRAYLQADKKRYVDGIPCYKDWILHNEKWYIHRYLVHLRYVEYYLNRYGRKHILFLWHWFRFKRLGFMLRITIYPNSIGRGLIIYHVGDFIFVKEACKIGENCTLRPGVVIGNKNGEGEFDAPVIVGNNVTFGVGVRVFGKLAIGDNVIIGANAVVTDDIPDNSIAVGVPAKVIKAL